MSCCVCLRHPGQGHRLHDDIQDESLEVWRRLLALIEEAVASGATELAPGRVLREHGWEQVVTLPSSIGRLTSVEHLNLYGSSLVRLPPEVGDMTALSVFTPYTSYRLHWFPYEITRCPALARSTVSTRAIYGNFKTRLPFPSLRRRAGNDPVLARASTGTCSICRVNAVDVSRARWISLRVATDVQPLLLFACSPECLENAGESPESYPPGPHLGGQIKQPPPEWGGQQA